MPGITTENAPACGSSEVITYFNNHVQARLWDIAAVGLRSVFVAAKRGTLRV